MAAQKYTCANERHNVEIQENLCHWHDKPLLREIYRSFHELIAGQLARGVPGITVEIGSGIGNIKEVIPECLRTDMFPNPWLDRTENAYRLSFADRSVANIILFDVFHHLRYPGTALEEWARVVSPGGHVIIFEPCISLLGLLVYGVLHQEPLALTKPIEWRSPPGWSPERDSYYAAQGNASRIFSGKEYSSQLNDWAIIRRIRRSAISYVASGGYSRKSLYPLHALRVMRGIDRLCDTVPILFATRQLIVLRKK